MKNCVSVAIATYNGEKYLRDQLDSIIMQTVPPDEIVACDDCSSDATVQILKDYESRYPHLMKVILNDTNLGYVKNFEKAIAKTSFDIVLLSDQDDIWMNDRVEHMLKESGDHLLVYTDSKVIDNSGNIQPLSYVKTASRYCNTDFSDLVFMKGIIQGSAMMITKKLYNKAVPFPAEIPHDYWMFMIASNDNSVAYCSESPLLYRIHGENLIGCLENKETLLTKLRKIKFLIRNRNRFLRMILDRGNKILLRNVLNDYNAAELTSICNSIDFIVNPKKSVRFSAIPFFFKYRNQFYSLYEHSFILTALTMLTIWLTPKNEIAGE